MTHLAASTSDGVEGVMVPKGWSLAPIVQPVKGIEAPAQELNLARDTKKVPLTDSPREHLVATIHTTSAPSQVATLRYTAAPSAASHKTSSSPHMAALRPAGVPHSASSQKPSTLHSTVQHRSVPAVTGHKKAVPITRVQRASAPSLRESRKVDVAADVSEIRSRMARLRDEKASTSSGGLEATSLDATLKALLAKARGIAPPPMYIAPRAEDIALPVIHSAVPNTGSSQNKAEVQSVGVPVSTWQHAVHHELAHAVEQEQSSNTEVVDQLPHEVANGNEWWPVEPVLVVHHKHPAHADADAVPKQPAVVPIDSSPHVSHSLPAQAHVPIKTAENLNSSSGFTEKQHVRVLPINDIRAGVPSKPVHGIDKKLPAPADISKLRAKSTAPVDEEILAPEPQSTYDELDDVGDDDDENVPNFPSLEMGNAPVQSGVPFIPKHTLSGIQSVDCLSQLLQRPGQPCNLSTSRSKPHVTKRMHKEHRIEDTSSARNVTSRAVSMVVHHLRQKHGHSDSGWFRMLANKVLAFAHAGI